MSVVINGTTGVSLIQSTAIPAGAVTRANVGYDGAVLQMKQYVYRNPISISPGSNYATTDIGVTAAITPTSSSSFIMVQCMFPISEAATGTGSGQNSTMRVVRDIGGGGYNTMSQITSLSGANGLVGQTLSFWGLNTNWSNNQTCPIQFLDNPATTSAVTYKWQWLNSDGTGGPYLLGINQSLSDNTPQRSKSPAMYIILSEISNAGGTISINSTAS